MNIGFVGLGNMGGPLARKLLTRIPLEVFDIDPARVRDLEAEGAKPASSATALAAECDIVLLCLPSSKEVEQVTFADGGLADALSPGALVIDMTTGDPAATRDMAGKLQARDIELIDAPVSGGPRGAREGTIAIMVGASADQFARARQVLDHISVNVVHAGTIGAGHAIKAGNNLLNLICRMAAFEVISMLVRDGVEPSRAVDIVNRSSGRSYATEITLPDNILSGKMHQGFTTALMHKDSGVALDVAAAHGLDMPLGQLARTLLERAIEEHGMDADMSAVALTYETMTGARIRPQPS